MKKILLVEDDASLAMGIEYAIKNEGFEVHPAGCLEKARSILKTETPDLILLDVMLPDGSGYDLCREIRKESDIPVIFLTACDEEVNVVLGLDIGGDDYITKPFRLKELISRINAVMRRHKHKNPGENNILASGDLLVYTLEGKVKRNGADLVLTSMEYRLLLTLMKNSGRILSRNAILEALWDVDGEFVDDNTLSVYIKRLREKIGDQSSGQGYITTIRGMGYKWDREVKGDMG